MLVSAKEMLEKAVEGHYAVGQFNINNLEWTFVQTQWVFHTHFSLCRNLY